LWLWIVIGLGVAAIGLLVAFVKFLPKQ